MTCFEIWNLIIGAIGAIATFSAVLVALWQTKYANRKRLKCSFIENYTVCDSTASKNSVGMSISNIGNNKVTIQSWGIKTAQSYLLILTSSLDPDRFDKAVAVKTPYELETEKNITFFYVKDLFCAQVKKLIERGEIRNNKRIQFVVYDVTGKQYKVKSKKAAKEYCPT